MDTLKEDKPRILIVDDKPMNLISLEAAIDCHELEVIKAGSGNEALGLILDHDFALILLDVQMPEMDGFETAELIRMNPKTSHIPIIFVSAINKEDSHLFKGYDTGAVDYLFKPVDSHILKSKIRVFIDLYQQKKESEILSHNLKQALLEAENNRKIIENQNKLLKELAVKDGLTGLYNHRHMIVVAESEFNRANRYKTELSCLLMDIDFFKDVNDSLGHPFGDYVLKEFSLCLQEYMRESDFLFRYGGEEFLALLPQTDLEGARSSAEKFRTTIENKLFNDGNHTSIITVSIGISSLHYNHPASAFEIIDFADKALFTAKAEGRNRVVVFHEHEHALPDGVFPRDLQIRHLKESLESILKKTKKASILSLELLARDRGGSVAEKRSRLLREYISLLGYHLNLPLSVIETFKLTALIHDCFQTLLGKEGPWHGENITDEQPEEVKNLPYILAELTEKFDFFANERSVLLTHHEHYDGSGYPEGLKENQIPMGARIFAIADSFVNLTCGALNGQEKSFEDALIQIVQESGKKFDPTLVNHFLAALIKSEPNKISDHVYQQALKILAQGKKSSSPKNMASKNGVHS
ncbi:MAG: diguanylate cyclase [Proteobacteria bacterium]|nr:diguanylate cyclase [Pseudomonadota bacterium]